MHSMMGMQVHGSCVRSHADSAQYAVVCMSGTARSVCNYEEDTVSNDDENDGFRRAHESPKGSLAPQGRT